MLHRGGDAHARKAEHRTRCSPRNTLNLQFSTRLVTAALRLSYISLRLSGQKIFIRIFVLWNLNSFKNTVIRNTGCSSVALDILEKLCPPWWSGLNLPGERWKGSVEDGRQIVSEPPTLSTKVQMASFTPLKPSTLSSAYPLQVAAFASNCLTLRWFSTSYLCVRVKNPSPCFRPGPDICFTDSRVYWGRDVRRRTTNEVKLFRSINTHTAAGVCCFI